jgi:hypothetical protein
LEFACQFFFVFLRCLCDIQVVAKLFGASIGGRNRTLQGLLLGDEIGILDFGFFERLPYRVPLQLALFQQLGYRALFSRSGLSSTSPECQPRFYVSHPFVLLHVLQSVSTRTSTTHQQQAQDCIGKAGALQPLPY